jgi:formamidopyrimidine-DNA glycosylase
MPELPEVETIRRGLSRLIVGKKVTGAENFASPKSFPNAEGDVEQFLYGATITDVRRRAKVLLIDLSSEYTLVTHLKMTGQIIVVDGNERWGGGHPNDSFVRTLPDNTTRERLDFSDGSHLYFNDLRKFGWMKLYPTIEVPNIDFMQRVGPEPLEDAFTSTEFIPRVRKRNGTTIKAAILDQTVLAGVGNIYADESLWASKIHPAKRVRDVNDSQLTELLANIKAVMNLSIAHGGSTDKNYVDAEGKKGSYLQFANVFRREGQACPRHPDVLIEKLRVAGRGTHICPVCQVI